MRPGFRDAALVLLAAGGVAAWRAPQLYESRSAGRIARIDAALADLRRAVAAYRVDHAGVAPGGRDGADPARTAVDPSAAFEQQLVLYTDLAGRTSERRTGAHRFGPYLRQGRLPLNPLTGTRTLAVSSARREPAGLVAWRFDVASGRLEACDRDGRRIVR